MRRELLVSLGVCIAALLISTAASAQTYGPVTEKTIAPVKGKKLFLKGAVLDGDEVSYRFRAREGQNLTIKIIGRDADFSLYLINGLDARLIAENTQFWLGRLTCRRCCFNCRSLKLQAGRLSFGDLPEMKEDEVSSVCQCDKADQI